MLLKTARLQKFRLNPTQQRLTVKSSRAHIPTNLRLAAGWLLVEEAGGRVSNLRNEPLCFGEALLASNGRLHDAMAALLLKTA